MHDYIRDGNPTRTSLEKALAACEDAKYGRCHLLHIVYYISILLAYVYSSGMAAVSAVVHCLLKSGDHIVSVNDVYGGVNRYFRKVASNFGITATLVDATVPSNVENAIKENTKVH